MMKKWIKSKLVFDYTDRTLKFWKIRNILKNNGCNKILKRFYIMNMNKILSRFNASVPLNSEIQYFHTPHGLNGIFISEGAVIGKGCTIFQQVTIGSVTSKGSKRIGAPQIGDDVYIGAGAKIIGNVRIGNHVRIGANCTVSIDIADNCTVVMDKPRIIENKRNDNTFIPFQSDLMKEVL